MMCVSFKACTHMRQDWSHVNNVFKKRGQSSNNSTLTCKVYLFLKSADCTLRLLQLRPFSEREILYSLLHCVTKKIPTEATKGNS